MTRKQKTYIAYFLACIDLFLSLVLWTRVLAGREAEMARNNGEQLIATVVQPIAEQEVSHKAASDGRVTAPNDSGEDASSSSIASEKSQSEGNTVLIQWGLTQRYSLSIPSLSVRAPVFVPDRKYWDAGDWDLLERQMQVGLSYGVVTYPHAVPPGERGTLIIAGHSSPPDEHADSHSFGKIFEKLPDLDVGAEIVVRFGTTSVTYEVTDTMVVAANDTSILSQQSEESMLKLITCYPIGSVKDRLVIIAKRK